MGTNFYARIIPKEEDKQIQPKYGRGMNLNDILSRSYKYIPLKY